MELISVGFLIIIIVVMIIITRIFGAWMLRINEVISWQAKQWTQNNEIIQELKKIGMSNDSNTNQ
ncbi:MAG: putative membrane protein [Halioglobus sp.]|jgi:uncharacterized membrane protein